MPCNASYARFIFGKFFTSTIILYVLLFAQKVLFLQKVGVTLLHALWRVRAIYHLEREEYETNNKKIMEPRN
jgi:hypothetical protein